MGCRRAVAEETAPRHLALRGRHRFSRYELAIYVDPLWRAILLTHVPALLEDNLGRSREQHGMDGGNL